MERKHESKPYQGPFLFINSTADKPATSKNDSFTISSHVSKTHRNWLKAERLKRLKASLGKAPAHRSILVADPIISKFSSLPLAASHGPGSSSVVEPIQVCVGNDESLSRGQKRSVLDTTRRSPDRLLGIATGQHVLAFEASQEPDDQRDLHTSRTRHDRQAMRPMLALWKGSSDPFSVAAVHLTPRDHEIICLAQRFLVFAAWPEKASAVFRAPIADKTNSHIQLQQIITDEAEIHAILASGYHVAANLSTGSTEVAAARRFAHKSRAVALLRQKLSKVGPSESVATLIRLLISLDFQAGDFAASLVHLRGLWSISSSSPRKLPHTQELLIVSDVWIALALLKIPEIPPARYDPGPRLTQSFDIELQLLEHHFPHLCSPYTTSSDTTVLDLPVLSLLNAAAEIVNTKAIMAKIEGPELQQNVVWWMHRRATAISGLLMTGYVDATKAAVSPAREQIMTTRNMINGAACLCAILFMNLKFVDFPSNYNFSKTFQAIEPVLRCIQHCMDEMPDEFNKAYLWALFMCAMGNDVYGARGDISYSTWPVPEFLRVCKRRGLTETDALTKILSQFQYFPQMDGFIGELLHGAQSIPVTNIIPWSRWCFALDHYVG
ncbi:hypothetical protein LTR10_016639 [Elasticomyces elasticus]|nr:hypothetical protein LTR10_016639 [Elasticomyces elasticus]